MVNSIRQRAARLLMPASNHVKSQRTATRCVSDLGKNRTSSGCAATTTLGVFGEVHGLNVTVSVMPSQYRFGYLPEW